MIYAITSRLGTLPGRWTSKQAQAMYKAGVAYAQESGEILSVWTCTCRGELCRYHGAATRKLSDKIVAVRNAQLAEVNRSLHTCALPEFKTLEQLEQVKS